MLIFTSTIAVLAITAGCQPPDAGSRGKGALSIPPDGKVNLVASPLENSSTRQHFKWSVIGERNWMDAKAADGVLSLGKTYPINSPTQRGGCNIWEADVTAEAKGENVVWEAKLHGSDGTTVNENGQVPLAGRTLADVFQVQQDQSTLSTLPADLPLVRVGDKAFRLQISDK